MAFVKVVIPLTPFNLSLLPNLKENDSVIFSEVSLGFATSIYSPAILYSNPLTYAVPGETLTTAKSSFGVFPSLVLSVA